MPNKDSWLFPLFTDHVTYQRSMEKFSDLHIYTGSKCNRKCDFCIVSGRPDGWYEQITMATLEATLALVPMDGTIKFYGGEPTLDLENLLWAMLTLRENGFQGWFTIFSNGVLADRVIAILDADQHTDVVLNYSILHGEDALPLPEDSLKKLQQYARLHPNRLFSSHAGIFPFGRGDDFAREVGPVHLIDRMHTSMEKKLDAGHMDRSNVERMEERSFRVCPRCRPSVGTDNRHHACPFAVESSMPHFDLGSVDDPAEEVLDRYQRFIDWIDEVLEPEAERRGIHPCLVCTNGLTNLPLYHLKSRRLAEVGD